MGNDFEFDGTDANEEPTGTGWERFTSDAGVSFYRRNGKGDGEATPLTVWEAQIEALVAFDPIEEIEAFEAFQASMEYDARLLEARRYAEARRPLLRAHYETAHPIGCDCAACIEARGGVPPVAFGPWPGPARSRRLNGK